MYVNGGQRGLNLRLAPQDLLAVTGAKPVPTQ
jgi:prolyl-tRNA editing enzyme YbaK/EbsC (Cys-tRNA(Pro) deacylase)